MPHELVFIEKTQNVSILTLNNPPVNSLSRNLIEDLDRGLDEILMDKTCRCLIVTGNGKKAFASGADIRELENFDEKNGTAAVERAKEVFGRIRSCTISDHCSH